MIGGTEVVAVYVEERIRTYGFEVGSHLLLLTRAVTGPEPCIPSPSGLGPDASGPRLLMAAAQADPAVGLTVQMLLDPQGDPNGWEASQWLPGEGPILECLYPVDAVWFHGPHFGDRHGIAAAALSALRRGEVPLICACFAGASVFLVLPPGEGEPALAWLRAQFSAPSSGSDTP